jgi:hypothetical protein
MGAPKNLLRASIAALRGTHPLAYPIDMSRVLRSVRLVASRSRRRSGHLMGMPLAVALKSLATVFRGSH